MKYKIDPAKTGITQGRSIRDLDDLRGAIDESGCWGALLRHLEATLDNARRDGGYASDEARCIEHLIRLLQ